MSKNYLSIELGGEQRGLKYNMAALEAIVEHTNNQDLGMVVTRNVVVNIYAGLIGNCAVKDEEPIFTIDTVKKWISKMDYEEVQKIHEDVEKVILSAYPRKEPVSGEGDADTQRQALDVA